MKKALLLFCLVFSFGLASYAQTAPQNRRHATVETAEAAKQVKQVKAEVAALQALQATYAATEPHYAQLQRMIDAKLIRINQIESGN